uniref:Si:ch73-180n10.1 n=1 Tax=Labrus bergylta TaxID=56723 RepID=A0A3Q3LZH9_9LABR
MPERCVPVNRCGTHAPLWLAGPHPRRRDGIVTRRVCAHWNKNCCAFESTPINIKKCRGNYYVYQFTKPTACYLAYFFASFPGQLKGKVNRIKYSKVLVNVGQGFNRRTGVFRAPVPGVYQFFFSTQTANAGLKTDLWLGVNGYWVAVSHTNVSRPSSVGSLSTYMTFLRRGALVYVTHNCGHSWANSVSSTITFGG